LINFVKKRQMTTIVIDDKTKMGKLVVSIVKETNCGKVIDTKNVDELEAIIKKTERDIKLGRTKKIATDDLWK